MRVGLVVLYFAFPAAKPVIGGLFRAVASVFPVIGSVTEKMVAKFKSEKPLLQTVSGGQRFKEAIQAADMPEATKEKVIDIFRQSMSMAQDESSQKRITAIKAENRM